MPITLADIRALNTDFTDYETGIKYTTDRFGNEVQITPTEVIESPERPGSPLAVRPELARGYKYEGSLREPQAMTFRDEAGNLVTLRETDIRPYLFDPSLIEREADIARVSAPPGQVLGETETYREPFKPSGEVYKKGEEPVKLLRPGEKEAIPRDVKEASERIKARATEGITPPGPKPTAEGPGPVDFLNPEARNNFEEFVFKKLGGDPRGLNPHLEVQKLVTDDTAQQLYIQNWEDGMPTWFDLSDADKKKVASQIRSSILPELEAEITAKQQAYKIAMDRYDRTRKAYEDRYKFIQAETEKGLKLERQEREKMGQMRRTMAQNLKRITDNIKTIEELKETKEPGWEDRVKKLETANTQLEADIKAAREHLGVKGEGGVPAPGKGKPAPTKKTAAPTMEQRPANVPEDAVQWVTYETDVTAPDGTIIPAGTYYRLPDGTTKKVKEK